MMEYMMIGLLAVSLILNLIVLVKLSKKGEQDSLKQQLQQDIERSNREVLTTMQSHLQLMSNFQKDTQTQIADIEAKRFQEFSTRTQDSITTLRKSVVELAIQLDSRFNHFQKNNDAQLLQIRDTLEKKVTSMQESNEKKLEEMRATVDEKLQQTLEDRISKSFELVSKRLEEVYKSLGEMQKLSTGVDDLKRVLSNVKTRGILGEVQLGAILEQILTADQYDTNVATKKGSNERVEFAIKLPGEQDEQVYLPIDAKFPMDAYQQLLDAYDSGNSAEVESAAKVLLARIKGFAKDIRTKYIDVPHTTEFAIMFLPIEGLYAEVVRRGMVEELQKEKINIAGPTTMAALLNSLQMGFKTLAIQKRSSEVWSVLEGVKQEFGKFKVVLDKTQSRMRQASEELDKLIGTRTNAIQRRLRDVSVLEHTEQEIEVREE